MELFNKNCAFIPTEDCLSILFEAVEINDIKMVKNIISLNFDEFIL